MTDRTRRSVLAAAATLGVGGLAGCLDDISGSPTEDFAADPSTATDGDATTAASGTALPTREQSLHVADSADRLRENVVSGGPGKDGIPSIDEPTFEAVGAVGDRLLDGHPVFGVEVDGVAKAYPQYILVWHEIANDVVGDTPLAVTYCPLTGTAMAFERGDVEFGVSGNLVNTNLVMYDRATDSRWPQVLATAIRGDLQGQSLREHPVTWTTWDAWRAANPDGAVLTEDTGDVRDYGRDPYGDYDPKRGYYQSDDFLFSPMRQSDRLHPKAVVHGARSADGAFAVAEDVLRRARVAAGTAGSVRVVVVYDAGAKAGVAYANPDGVAVRVDGEAYVVDGERRGPRELGLPRLPSLDAMFFAWYAFYPDSEFVLEGADAVPPTEATARWEVAGR